MIRTSLKAALFTLLVFASLTAAYAQTDIDQSAADRYADKKMKHLSLEEKVAQLMFVRAPLSFNNNKLRHEFEKNFSSHNVGGVCFFLIILIGRK